MKTRRQWSWAGAVAAGVMILGGSTLAQAATICPPPDRYIAYNVEFFNSMIPRVGGPGGSASCFTDHYLTNYLGTAVGQIKVHSAPPGYTPCDFYSVQVMTGAYQWGPSNSAWVNSNNPVQSLKVGNALLMKVTVFSVSFDTGYTSESFYNDSRCPLSEL